MIMSLVQQQRRSAVVDYLEKYPRTPGYRLGDWKRRHPFGNNMGYHPELLRLGGIIGWRDRVPRSYVTVLDINERPVIGVEVVLLFVDIGESEPYYTNENGVACIWHTVNGPATVHLKGDQSPAQVMACSSPVGLFREHIEIPASVTVLYWSFW